MQYLGGVGPVMVWMKKWINKRIALCLSIRETFDWMTMMFQQWRSYLSFHVLWMKHINLMFSVSFICRQILIKLQLRLCYLFNFFFKKLCLSILEKTIIRYNTVSDFMGGYPASPLNCQNKVKSWFQLYSMIIKPMNSMV